MYWDFKNIFNTTQFLHTSNQVPLPSSQVRTNTVSMEKSGIYKVNVFFLDGNFAIVFSDCGLVPP
jgi:purine-nucleoside phosphorylase